jgi:hypothetical protein
MFKKLLLESKKILFINKKTCDVDCGKSYIIILMQGPLADNLGEAEGVRLKNLALIFLSGH